MVRLAVLFTVVHASEECSTTTIERRLKTVDRNCGHYEVRIDPDLGLVRVARIVSAVDGGRILNQKLARSQVIGAVTMGIGITLLEETVFDAATGRVANATFADYLIPVNADVPDLDVVFVGNPDRFNPLGIKGIGEIGIVGVSAAIANAVFHATGRRIRSLPITIDKLL